MEQPPLDTDLVEYLIVAMPGLGPANAIAAALGRLVDDGAIRILDLAVIETSADGSVSILEPETVAGMEALVHSIGVSEGMLSESDLTLASTALRPGSAAVILVAEDHWAVPLADAARSAGGRVLAGERIPRHQVEAALSTSPRWRHAGRGREGGTE